MESIFTCDMEENQEKKKGGDSLVRPRLRDVKSLNGGSDWKAKADKLNLYFRNVT